MDWKLLAEILCEEFIGTCGISNIEDRVYQDTNEKIPLYFYYYIDEIMFLCDTCGWWCPAEELSINDSCYSCVEDN